MSQSVVWILVAIGFVYVILIAWGVCIRAEHRGWKRGFKAAEDIWKDGFYKLSELQRRTTR